MQKFTALLALASAANAASLSDVKHVIMLMMENRSFQHVSFFGPVSARFMHGKAFSLLTMPF